MVAVCATFYLFQQPTSGQAIDKPLVVGTSADYPPYAQIDLATGEIVGFEIDIMHEIARRLDKKIIIKDMPFTSLIIELMSGQIDLIAAGLSPTPERKKAVLFSYPYIDNDQLLIMSKKNSSPITNLADLYGKTVAVNTGYTSDTFLSKIPEISLIRLKSPADGFMALQTDSVDAFAIVQSSFDIFYKKQQADEYQIFEIPASADSCALAYEKNNKILQDDIDPIIKAMIKDKTVLALQKKWGLA